VLAGRCLLEVAQPIARDASAHVLVAHHGVEDARILGVWPGARKRKLLEHGIIEIVEDLRHRLVLVVMRVDVDDRKAVVATLLRLPGGVREQLGGVELLDRHAPEIIGLQFHKSYPCFEFRSSARKRGQRLSMPACLALGFRFRGNERGGLVRAGHIYPVIT
jgi:hypothetical protein